MPKKLQTRFEEITSLTDAVCRQHLNDEYAEVSRKMAAALARKRPSPLESGRANTWACGIVYTIGFVNFLFDKSLPPYMSAEDLCNAFGVAKSTGYNASKKIRDLFDLMQFDPRWTLPSLMDQNPMAWMISVNGLMIDARCAPRYIQAGILVDVKKGRETYQLPLADLEVTDYHAPQCQVVKDYAVWFANR